MFSRMLVRFTEFALTPTRWDLWLDGHIQTANAELTRKAVENAVAEFQKKYPTLPVPDINRELTEKLASDAKDRTSFITDSSVSEERLYRARVVLIGGMMFGYLLGGTLSSGGLVPLLIMPVASGMGAYAMTIVTIPMGCYLRIRGGLNALLRSYGLKKEEEEKKARSNAPEQKGEACASVVVNMPVSGDAAAARQGASPSPHVALSLLSSPPLAPTTLTPSPTPVPVAAVSALRQ